jgi:hypothetical protein
VLCPACMYIHKVIHCSTLHVLLLERYTLGKLDGSTKIHSLEIYHQNVLVTIDCYSKQTGNIDVR